MVMLSAMQWFAVLAQSGGPPASGEAMGAAAGAGFMIIWCLFTLVMMVLGLAAFVFWIWMLIDCVQNEPSEGNDRLVWILVIIFTNWIGALIYFIVRRPQRKQLYGQ